MSAFDVSALNKAVHDTLDQAMAAIPEGKTNAILIDGTYSQADGAHAKALWVHRLGEHWNIALEGAYDGPHTVSGKIASAIYW